MYTETEFQDLNVGDIVLDYPDGNYRIVELVNVEGFYADDINGWTRYFDGIVWDYTIPRKVS